MIVSGLQVAVLMGTGLLGPDGGQALAKGRKDCTGIVKDAKKACDSEIKDDYRIALGNRGNIADKEERATCIQKAKTERKEAKEDCKNQQDARKEGCSDLEETYYDPQVDPANLTDPDTITIGNANPYFPLVKEPEWIYAGREDADTLLEGITVTVTEDIKPIAFPEGSGNVWHFGEIAQNFIDGELIDVEGSWKAGRDSALPGIIMQASPAAGDIYRQEYDLGDAEELDEVVSVGKASKTVPLWQLRHRCSGDQ